MTKQIAHSRIEFCLENRGAIEEFGLELGKLEMGFRELKQRKTEMCKNTSKRRAKLNVNEMNNESILDSLTLTKRRDDHLDGLVEVRQCQSSRNKMGPPFHAHSNDSIHNLNTFGAIGAGFYLKTRQTPKGKKSDLMMSNRYRRWMKHNYIKIYYNMRAKSPTLGKEHDPSGSE
ncbi:hypothetical protein LguiA_002104 [Lonicera macranthoides]